MRKMNKKSLFEIFKSFEEIEPFGYKYAPQELKPIIQMIAEKKAKPSASIMVYGVYNAGKSTLINALLGDADRAKVSDHPETDQVHAYPWKGFELLDTPGIDAPIEHQKVTMTQLHSADVVIFVVNPRGVVEEAKTLSDLMDLVMRKKKLFLVLNCKDVLEPEDAQKLKDELLQRLQKLASDRGIDSALDHIPIHEINAKSALRGKLEGKNTLLNHSGLPRLEEDLLNFLLEIGENQLVTTISTELANYTQHVIEKITESTEKGSTRQLDIFASELAKTEINLRSGMKAAAEAKAASLEQHCAQIIGNSPQTAQAEITRWFELASQDLIKELQGHLKAVLADASIHLRDLESSLIASTSISIPDVALEKMGDTPSSPQWAEEDSSGTSLIKLSTLTPGIVELLKMLPKNLLKNIPIPMVGPAIALIEAVYSMFQGDQEEKRLQAQAKAYEEAQERRRQAIKDTSAKLAWNFKAAVIKGINDTLQETFNQIQQKLQALRSTLSQEQQSLSHDRALLERQLAFLTSRD